MLPVTLKSQAAEAELALTPGAHAEILHGEDRDTRLTFLRGDRAFAHGAVLGRDQLELFLASSSALPSSAWVGGSH
jgi:hypothetical protein